MAPLHLVRPTSASVLAGCARASSVAEEATFSGKKVAREEGRKGEREGRSGDNNDVLRDGGGAQWRDWDWVARNVESRLPA